MADDKIIDDWETAFDHLRDARDQLKSQMGKPGEKRPRWNTTGRLTPMSRQRRKFPMPKGPKARSAPGVALCLRSVHALPHGPADRPAPAL